MDTEVLIAAKLIVYIVVAHLNHSSNIWQLSRISIQIESMLFFNSHEIPRREITKIQ
jgi:hypothetical protein